MQSLPKKKRNRSDTLWNLSAQGEKCEFTGVNDHFLTQKWQISGGR